MLFKHDTSVMSLVYEISSTLLRNNIIYATSTNLMHDRVDAYYFAACSVLTIMLICGSLHFVFKVMYSAIQTPPDGVSRILHSAIKICPMC